MCLYFCNVRLHPNIAILDYWCFALRSNRREDQDASENQFFFLPWCVWFEIWALLPNMNENIRRFMVLGLLARIAVCLHRLKLVYFAWMNDVRQHSNGNVNFTLVGLLLKDLVCFLFGLISWAYMLRKLAAIFSVWSGSSSQIWARIGQLRRAVRLKVSAWSDFSYFWLAQLISPTH